MSPSSRARPRVRLSAPALAALASAALMIGGSFLRWTVVRFDLVTIRELSRSGWDEGDGKITVLIGIGGVIGAALLAAGVRERWLRLGLAVAGAVAMADCTLSFLDATSGGKPGHVADALGVAARGITADAGTGVFVAALAGLGLTIAGVVAEKPA